MHLLNDTFKKIVILRMLDIIFEIWPDNLYLVKYLALCLIIWTNLNFLYPAGQRILERPDIWSILTLYVISYFWFPNGLMVLPCNPKQSLIDNKDKLSKEAKKLENKNTNKQMNRQKDR